MKGMNKVYDLNTLEVGHRYFVRCGVWTGYILYCGHVFSEKEFTFTYGDNVGDWKNSFNISAPKSRLSVYKKKTS